MTRRVQFFSSDDLKAETHDATNRCDTSPRQVAATNRFVWHVKIIVAETEFCRCDLSHKFKLVWIRATYRSDKIGLSDLSQQQCRWGDLSRRHVAAICRILCLGLYHYWTRSTIYTFFSAQRCRMRFRLWSKNLKKTLLWILMIFRNALQLCPVLVTWPKLYE